MLKICKKCNGQFNELQVINGQTLRLRHRVNCLSCTPYVKTDNTPKIKVCKKCSKSFPQRYLHTDGKKYSLQRRDFCLECSPYKARNTKDLTKMPVAYDPSKRIRQPHKYRPLKQLPEKWNKVNWIEIQSFYDSGKSWNEVCSQFQVPLVILAFASKNGLFKSRTISETFLLKNPSRIGRKMSEETKQKLREARLNHLAKNPDKCNWKTQDKFKSIPCEKVKTELRELNIIFEEEHQPLLHKKRFYSTDIAFLNKKIIFEINGGQHYDTNSNLKPYYQIRHNLIEAEGWKVYEIPYHVAMRKGFVNDYIIPILNGQNPVYDIQLYKKKIGSVEFESTTNTLCLPL